MIGIYKITNLLNNKNYIGQSENIEQRIKQHKECILHSDKSWYPLARFEGKNNLDNFSFEILQECKNTELDELEEYWIKQYDSYNQGYNRTKDGNSIKSQSGIQLFIKYTNYAYNYTTALLTVLKTLNNIPQITYTDKLLIITFLTQLENKEPFFFTEGWIKQYTGISHDTYIACRARLSELGIFILNNRNSLTLSIDNLFNIGE